MLLTLLNNQQAPLQPNTPRQRQRLRVSFKQEHPTPDAGMGNGSIFTLKPGSPRQGSFVYGALGWTQSLSQIAQDGGIFSWDYNMVGLLRDSGFFTETPQ